MRGKGAKFIRYNSMYSATAPPKLRKIFRRMTLELVGGERAMLGKPSNPTGCSIFTEEIGISSHRARENMSSVSTPRSKHKHQPRGHLPVWEFPSRIIEEQAALQFGKIYSSLSEEGRCSS